MKKILIVAIACAVGASACSGKREPTEAQLGTLLRSERPTVPGTTPPVDALAVECLRAWSDDKELLNNLPMRSAGESGRKACRTRVDGWISDAARNPDKLTFAEISAPAAVRRAMSLLDGAPTEKKAPPQRAQQEKAPADWQPAPLAGTPETAPDGMQAPDPDVDLGAHGATLAKAESACQQVIEMTRTPNVNPRVGIIANYCSATLGRLRRTMENYARNGDSDGIEKTAGEVEKLLDSAHRALSLKPKS